MSRGPGVQRPQGDGSRTMTTRPVRTSLLALAAGVGWLACAAPVPDGAVVERVEPWGLAEEAGIEAGDVIVGWRTASGSGDAPSWAELLALEADRAPDGGVVLVVARDSGSFEVELADAHWGLEVRPHLADAGLEALAAAAERPDRERPPLFEELEAAVASAAPDVRRWAAHRSAVAALAAGEPEAALEAFRRAREGLTDPARLAPLLVDAALRLRWAGEESAEGYFEEAEATVRAAGRSTPSLVRALIGRASSRIDARELDASGELLEAAREEAARFAASDSLRAELAAALGVQAHVQGRLEVAEDRYQETLAAIPRRGGALAVRSLINLGMLHGSQGRFEASELDFLEALELLRTSPSETYQTARILNSLGVLNRNLLRLDRAEGYYASALEAFPAGGVEEAGVRNNLGNLAKVRGALDLATEHLTAALELRLALDPESLDVASNYHNLGEVHRAAGRLEEAERRLVEALKLKERLLPESLVLSSTLVVLGQTRLALGRPAAAEADLERALALVETSNPGSLDHGRAILLLGDVAAASGQPRLAIERWRSGLDVLGALRENISTEEGRARFSAAYADYYDRLSAALLERGATHEAFLVLETSRARLLRAMLQQVGARIAVAAAPDILAERRRQDSRIRRTLGRVHRLNAATEGERLRELRAELKALKARREELNERLYREARRLAEIEEPSRVSLERIRAHLPERSAGLLYFLGEERSHVFVVRPADATGAGLDAIELPVTATEASRRIGIFRSLIERGRHAPLEPALLAQGARLYDDLLRPVDEFLPPGTALVIAPDAALAELPFAALVVDRDTPQFLAELRPHTVVPSLTALAELGERLVERTPPELALAAFGAPRFDSGWEGSLDLRPLPGAGIEIERLDALFDDSVALSGNQATETAARELLPRARFVHFATHALLDRRFPLDSSLALTASAEEGADDGLLHGWEVLESPELSAELVSLAGCETGLGARWKGEGLVGLTQAFHYAGAPNVLASQWNVGDAWAGEMTARFYELLLEDLPPIEALARVQAEMIGAQSSEDAEVKRHPFYWASFTLFGTGRTAPVGTAPVGTARISG